MLSKVAEEDLDTAVGGLVAKGLLGAGIGIAGLGTLGYGAWRNRERILPFFVPPEQMPEEMQEAPAVRRRKKKRMKLSSINTRLEVISGINLGGIEKLGAAPVQPLRPLPVHKPVNPYSMFKHMPQNTWQGKEQAEIAAAANQDPLEKYILWDKEQTTARNLIGHGLTGLTALGTFLSGGTAAPLLGKARFYAQGALEAGDFAGFGLKRRSQDLYGNRWGRYH